MFALPRSNGRYSVEGVTRFRCSSGLALSHVRGIYGPWH